MMSPEKFTARLALAFTVLSIAAFAPDVGARPGGGSSYKGSSSSSSKGSSSSGSSSRSSSTSSGSSSRSSSTSSGSSSRSTGTSTGSTSRSTGTGTGSTSPSTGTGTGTYSGSTGSGTYSGSDSDGSSGSASPTPSSGGYTPPAEPDRPMSGSCCKIILFVLVIGAVLVYLLRKREGSGQSEWESSSERAAERQAEHARKFGSLLQALATIRASDPEFSFVLFEDFVYALFTEAHTARGAGRLAKLAPYLAQPALTTLGGLGQAQVRSVVVGALHVNDVQVDAGGAIRLEAIFESNYAEVGANGVEQAWYSNELWVFERPAGVRSRAPERSRIIDCPGCGAPLDKMVGRDCGYCKRTIDAGGFDWRVASIDILEREARPPMLTGTVEEQGTDLPTVVAPDAAAHFTALMQRDPQVTWAAFKARVGAIFARFHQGWVAREPKIVRPFLSDTLFQTQLYWIEAYRSQGLQNRTDGARIVSIELARVVSDARFDAVTVRVYATGLDFTVDARGQVVGGNPSVERNYTEYWTLIRGSDRAGAPRATAECPSCGASLDDITMAGTCRHCDAKVTAGQFDWVLSRIEQDESYG